jgi:hypothetical protein
MTQIGEAVPDRMDRVTHGGVLMAALGCLAILHADAAAATLPEAGARFAVQDHGPRAPRGT